MFGQARRHTNKCNFLLNLLSHSDFICDGDDDDDDDDYDDGDGRFYIVLFSSLE